MTTNTQLGPAKSSHLKEVCLGACRKVVHQINRAKEAVINEFRDGLHVPEHLLRLALNEAEALAWETAYPQLVFPDLAAEKARALVAWQGGQRMVGRGLRLANAL